MSGRFSELCRSATEITLKVDAPNTTDKTEFLKRQVVSNLQIFLSSPGALALARPPFESGAIATGREVPPGGPPTRLLSAMTATEVER